MLPRQKHTSLALCSSVYLPCQGKAEWNQNIMQDTLYLTCTTVLVTGASPRQAPSSWDTECSCIGQALNFRLSSLGRFGQKSQRLWRSWVSKCQRGHTLWLNWRCSRSLCVWGVKGRHTPRCGPSLCSDPSPRPTASAWFQHLLPQTVISWQGDTGTLQRSAWHLVANVLPVLWQCLVQAPSSWIRDQPLHDFLVVVACPCSTRSCISLLKVESWDTGCTCQDNYMNSQSCSMLYILKQFSIEKDIHNLWCTILLSMH